MTSGLRTQFAAYLSGLYRPEQVGDIRAFDYISVVFELSDGYGYGQADLKYFDRRTLAGGASENIDLSGAVQDQFGSTLNIAAIKAIAVSNPSTNDGDIVIGGAPNPWGTAFTWTISIPPGGVFILGGPGSGKAVAAGTGDRLGVQNRGTVSVDYDVLVIGTSI